MGGQKSLQLAPDHRGSKCWCKECLFLTAPGWAANGLTVLFLWFACANWPGVFVSRDVCAKAVSSRPKHSQTLQNQRWSCTENQISPKVLPPWWFITVPAASWSTRGQGTLPRGHTPKRQWPCYLPTTMTESGWNNIAWLSGFASLWLNFLCVLVSSCSPSAA